MGKTMMKTRWSPDRFIFIHVTNGKPYSWEGGHNIETGPRALSQYQDLFSRYDNSHYKDKTVSRPSYNGIPYTDKMTSRWLSASLHAVTLLITHWSYCSLALSHRSDRVYRQTSNIRRTLSSGKYNCSSLRCSWSIACRRCSNYIFTLDLTPGFNLLHKDNCKTRRETFKFCDLVCLIL